MSDVGTVDLRAIARACGSTSICVRKARKPHRCECRRIIEPGERYIRHVLAPGSEIDNTSWWVALECRSCVRPERAALLNPVVVEERSCWRTNEETHEPHTWTPMLPDPGVTYRCPGDASANPPTIRKVNGRRVR